MSHARRLTALLLISAASHVAALQAATLFDPALRFRALTTDHFVIYFHQGEDRLARRLAAIAEDTWHRLQQPLGGPQRTHVVLVDQTEVANGYATPLPRNTIVVSAAWPPSSEFIGNTDDWLRLVFTHEFTHIVHLARSEGGAQLVRSVFGRVPIAFPNLFLPTWHIEGIATYEESVITGAGRLRAGDFGAVAAEEARTRSLQPLDRVNGGLTDWPGGTAAYAYGLGFHRYLAEKFGPYSLRVLADATAGRVPYTTAPVFKRLYGQSLGDLWRDYQSSLLTATTLPAAIDPGLRRITRHGFIVTGPRFDKWDDGVSIVYSVRTPSGFPTLNRVGSDGSKPTRVTTRYLGTTTAIGRDGLYFDQQDFRRNVGVYSDLYLLSRTSGHVTRITEAGRLMDPDLSPDGTTLACVQSRPGQRDLVLLKATSTHDAASTITTLLSEAETQFDAPRWSPDGRMIAVERHRLGGFSDVVVVDVQTRSVRVLASEPRSRIVTPAWRQDGRAVVVAIAAEDQPFNLYELAADGVGAPRQLTHTTGGATWPDVSPDGRAIVFVGYTTDGFDLFTMPYPMGPPPDGPVSAPSTVAIAPPTAAGASEPPEYGSQPYSPIATLKPTSWSPVIEADSDQIRVGAAVGAYDALGYHFYSASASWLVSSPAGVPKPGKATPDWSVSYAYDRWRPTFWATAKQSTSFLEGPATAADTPAAATLREREIEAGVVFPIRHARVSHTGSVSLLRASDLYTMPDRTVSQTRGAARTAWAATSAHTYGYSISPEGGGTAGATAEIARPGLGAFAPATTVTGDGRAYLPSFAPHHVLAVRLAGGRSTGDPGLRRTFHLGGAAPDGSVTDFGRSAISLLRGFPADTFAGSHVALMNVDYRFPIARPQRGIGTWPLFLHTVHAAVFGDAGHAWTRAFRADAIKTSFGAEISAKIVAGYFFPLTATLGAARGHDGSGTVADRTTIYVRIGRAY
jgi:Tol biopolymer transport system component